LERARSLLAFVIEHVLDHAPAGIQDGLGHLGLHELGAAHVAYDDELIPVHDGPTELVQGIGATACDLAVNAL
jgi:predicted N-formylglutamate amidohydrolase